MSGEGSDVAATASQKTNPMFLNRLIRNSGQVRFQIAGLVLLAITLTSFALASSGAVNRSKKKTASVTPAIPLSAGPPRFFNYQSPQGVADSVGEPSIGSNWKTENTAYGTSAQFKNKFVNGADNPIPNGGTTLFFGGFNPSLVRIIFDDCSSPAGAFWQNKPLLTANSPRGFGDPILFTDHANAAELATGVSNFGRTFVSQLEGLTPAGSTTDLTDNDGDTFTPSEGSNAPSCVDHQTIGAGPFHSPLTGSDPLYPHAVYYASQCVADATAGLSVDGGRTFPTQSVMFTVADCDGLHGHLKVAPDGTVYVPDKGCGGNVPLLNGGVAAAIVSENNGLTWAIRPIPNNPPFISTTKGDDDPSLGVATDGTIYLGFQSSDGHPRIAVSHDKGVTWSNPVDVGASVVNGGPVLNTAFPEVAAGDPNRAVFAFYGSENGGSNYNQPDFPGVWYLYIATTFDGGVTWRTENVTPGDPIQRGGICGSGTCRNQLDFFDVTIDKEGRILVGWDDGCVSATCISGGANDFTAKGVITRQSGGKRMFSAFDPVEPAVPGAPMVTAGVDSPPTRVQLSWPVPDNGGSPVTGYHIYRRDANTGFFALLATTPVPNYTDTTINTASVQPYRVTAINLQGEGPYCTEVAPTVIAVPNPCKLPGVLVNNDLNPDGSDNDGGANTPPDPRANIRQLFIAEPFFGAGVNKLVFTMQLAPSTTPGATTPPPSSQWYIVWQRLFPDADFDRYYVGMKTDAAGNLSFEYGKFGVPLDATNPNPNANVPVKLGDADSGSYNVATGLVTITLSNSKAENVALGQSLSRVNVRTYFARPDDPVTGPGPKTQSTASDITGDGNYTLVGNAACSLTVPLLDVVSRKTHGDPGDFDIHLPQTGGPGIECRTGPTTGVHKVIFTFGNPLVGVGGASVSGGGSVGSSGIGTDPHQYIVNLTGVPNAARLSITLTGVTDTAGDTTSSLSVPMGVLLGDVNADGVVNSGDVTLVRKQSGNPVSEPAGNFRDDITTDGVINSGDITLVRKQSGTPLPP